MNMFKNALVSLTASFGFIVGAHASTIDFSGLTHTSLGTATLNIAGAGLVVSNIGLTGNDGVSISLPSNTTLFSPTFADLGSASPSQNGNYLQFKSYGSFNGIDDQLISSFTAIDVGSQIHFILDMGSVTSSNLTAQYFRNNTLVATETIADFANALWTSDRWLAAAGNDEEPNGQLTFDQWLFVQPVDITSPNNTLYTNIDRINILTTELDGTFGGYSSASVTASGISSFTITNELLTVPEPNTFLLIGLVLTVWALISLAKKRSQQISALSLFLAHEALAWAGLKCAFSDEVGRAASGGKRWPRRATWMTA